MSGLVGEVSNIAALWLLSGVTAGIGTLHGVLMVMRAKGDDRSGSPNQRELRRYEENKGVYHAFVVLCWPFFVFNTYRILLRNQDR